MRVAEHDAGEALGEEARQVGEEVLEQEPGEGLTHLVLELLANAEALDVLDQVRVQLELLQLALQVVLQEEEELRLEEQEVLDVLRDDVHRKQRDQVPLERVQRLAGMQRLHQVRDEGLVHLDGLDQALRLRLLLGRDRRVQRLEHGHLQRLAVVVDDDQVKVQQRELGLAAKLLLQKQVLLLCVAYFQPGGT